jgi:hypothetical protein
MSNKPYQEEFKPWNLIRIIIGERSQIQWKGTISPGNSVKAWLSCFSCLQKIGTCEALRSLYRGRKVTVLVRQY